MDLDQLIKLLQDIRFAKGGSMPVFVDIGGGETVRVVTGEYVEPECEDGDDGRDVLVATERVHLELGLK